MRFMPKDRPLAGFLGLVFLLFFIQSGQGYADQSPVPIWQYEIIAIFPHDPEAFTQGLVWQDGFLYEGTGLYGKSSLRRVDLETGQVKKQHNLSEDFFGEGITIFEKRIYQLTWKSKTGFIYEQENFQLVKTFSYSHEGWGITHDEKNLIISDGTSVLHFVDPLTMKEIKRIEIHKNGVPVNRINELEYIKGKIFANIWLTDWIVVIEPQSGKITAWLDLSGILDSLEIIQETNVLNGIAYDSEKDCLFVTGKLWPVLFKIKIYQR